MHVAVGGLALLLRYLSWRQAAAMAVLAFLFNWQLLPRIGGRGLWRVLEVEKGHPVGILIYPLSVLGLVLVFREDLWMVAAVWAMLAAGDGMATIVGQSLGGPRLPWNPRKSWAGFCAFVAFGTLLASVLVAWTLGLPLRAAGSPWIVGLTLPLALFCGLVESAPTTLDDNLTVPVAGAVMLALLVRLEARALLADPDTGPRLILGLGLSAVAAGLALMARALDLGGALSAIVIGAAIIVGLGPAGLVPLAAFFLAGSLTTRLRYAAKESRGIAQERGGARGWRNVWANGGVPAFMALLAAAGPTRAAFTIAYAAAVATAAADTGASEIGKAYGRRALLLPTFRAVAPGTQGALSREGTLAGLLCALMVAAAGGFAGLYRWPMAVAIAAAGLLGSLLESLLGAVAEGRGWMGHDLLNVFNTAVGAALGLAAANLL